MDANEMLLVRPIRSNITIVILIRYNEVKKRLSTIKGVPPRNIFLGNGSDEAIDILFRSFCNPGIDNVILSLLLMACTRYGQY